MLTRHQNGHIAYRARTDAQIAAEEERASVSRAAKKEAPRKLFGYYSDEEVPVESRPSMGCPFCK